MKEFIRPSLTLILDLDERLAAKDTILEIKRGYSYIGCPLIRSHTACAPDAPYTNYARILVGLGARKYLFSKDEGADELWNEVVSRWIGNMLWKIGSTMRTFNRRQRKIGLSEIVFDNFDIELQGGEFVISFHPDLLSYVDEDLKKLADHARELLNDGTFEGAMRVRIPADAEFEKQKEEAFPIWQAEHPEPEEEVEEEDAPEEPEIPEMDVFSEEWLAWDKEAKSYENTAVAPTDSDELPPIERIEEPEPPEPFNFEVDYRIWSVIYPDGEEKFFDSVDGEFLEEAK